MEEETRRIFEHPNTCNGAWKCPFCNDDADRPVTLLIMAATKDFNAEALQVHVDCFDEVMERINK